MSSHTSQARNLGYRLYSPLRLSLESFNSCPPSRHLGGGGGGGGGGRGEGEAGGRIKRQLTEGAGLAVVSLAQSRKCAGDKAAMWQDVMDF
ncbi:hypothetical protein EYF80_058684 [Liparis tanakae]|uniref:Uncharacterized protein n=1 Tax=Liparis tanakae TaxID=230148 RepID=A0A4Z2ES19_9TELE|nr:hypothetical protein EYF80_058684 [Liparis tanakae]